MEQRGQEFDSFKELVQKIVDAEAKAALWPRSYICDTNQYCLRGSQIAYSTTAKILSQGHQMKSPQVKETKKPQESKPLDFQRSENAETSEKARKEKKNNCRHWRGHRAPKGGRLQEESTPSTGIDNTSTAKSGTSKKNQNRGARQDPA